MLRTYTCNTYICMVYILQINDIRDYLWFIITGTYVHVCKRYKNILNSKNTWLSKVESYKNVIAS